MGYVGTRSEYLPNAGINDLNAVPPGAMLDDPDGDPHAYRPLRAYNSLYVGRNDAWSNYHALQALLSRQRGSFNVTASYTFSKALGVRTGEVGPASGSEYILPVRDVYYGVLGTDRTHVASLAVSWLLGGWKERPWLDAIAGGWQLAAIGAYVSGPPLQSSSTPNFNMQGTNSEGVVLDAAHITGGHVAPFPVATCDPRTNVPDGSMFNPACFAAPTAGQNGNFIWPYVRGNGYKNLDLSLVKNFSVGRKGQKLQLRIAAYNALNHPTWAPDRTRNLTLLFERGVQTNPDFGKINRNNRYGRRIVQLALRYTF